MREPGVAAASRFHRGRARLANIRSSAAGRVCGAHSREDALLLRADRGMCGCRSHRSRVGSVSRNRVGRSGGRVEPRWRRSTRRRTCRPLRPSGAESRPTGTSTKARVWSGLRPFGAVLVVGAHQAPAPTRRIRGLPPYAPVSASARDLPGTTVARTQAGNADGASWNQECRGLRRHPGVGTRRARASDPPLGRPAPSMIDEDAGRARRP